jgi:hypothetical protein
MFYYKYNYIIVNVNPVSLKSNMLLYQRNEIYQLFLGFAY